MMLILTNKKMKPNNLTILIKEAFFNINCFAPYYDVFNTFFRFDRIYAIHNAKTIAVVIRCTRLHQTYGFSYSVLFETLREIFGKPESTIMLSDLVHLSDFESFLKCVNEILIKYDTFTDTSPTESETKSLHETLQPSYERHR